MWDRTVTVGSAGSKSINVPSPTPPRIVLTRADPHPSLFRAETFAATGWRVGWLIGPQSIIHPTLAATTRIVFCSNSPLQEATAVGLEQAKKRGFLQQQCDEYAERRKILTDGFDRLGMKYTNPQGSYFVLLVRVLVFVALYPISHLHVGPASWGFWGLNVDALYRILVTSSGLTIIRSLRAFLGEGVTSGESDHFSTWARLRSNFNRLYVGHVGLSRWRLAFPLSPLARYTFRRSRSFPY